MKIEPSLHLHLFVPQIPLADFHLPPQGTVMVVCHDDAPIRESPLEEHTANRAGEIGRARRGHEMQHLLRGLGFVRSQDTLVNF